MIDKIVGSIERKLPEKRKTRKEESEIYTDVTRKSFEYLKRFLNNLDS